MPIVAMPDGTQVSFPDEMPSDQIRSLITQKFPDAAKQAAAGQQAAPSTLMDTLKGVPSAILGRLSSLASTGGQAAATEMSDPQLASEIPNPQQTQDIIEKNVTGSLYKPQTAMGRVGSEALAAPFDPSSYVGPGGPLRALASSALASGLSGGAGEAADAMGASPAASMAARAAAGLLTPTLAGKANLENIPSVAALKGEGGAGMTAVRDMPYASNRNAVQTFSDKLIGDLDNKNWDADIAPQTNKLIDEFGQNTVTTAKDYDKLKIQLRNVTKDGGTDADAAGMALSRLDQHINDLTPADSTFGGMQMGDPNAFKTLWNESKGNYAAGMRGENVEDRINNAKVNTDAANSGMNLGNNLRAQFKPMLKDTDLMRGMDPVERAAVKNLVKGNFATNAMRYGSNVLGGGGGIGSLAIPLIAGGAIGGGLGSPSEGNASAAGLALMGHLLRRGANASTLRQANYLSALVRSRAPMSPGMVMPQSLLAKRLLNAASASQQQ